MRTNDVHLDSEEEEFVDMIMNDQDSYSMAEGMIGSQQIFAAKQTYYQEYVSRAKINFNTVDQWLDSYFNRKQLEDAFSENVKKFVYEIKAEDVGKSRLLSQGRVVHVADFMGPIQQGDIGKRIIEVKPGIYQVENDEQLKARSGS